MSSWRREPVTRRWPARNWAPARRLVDWSFRGSVVGRPCRLPTVWLERFVLFITKSEGKKCWKKSERNNTVSQRKKHVGLNSYCLRGCSCHGWLLWGRRDVVSDDVQYCTWQPVRYWGTEVACTQSTSRSERGTRVHVYCVPGTVSRTHPVLDALTYRKTKTRNLPWK